MNDVLPFLLVYGGGVATGIVAAFFARREPSTPRHKHTGEAVSVARYSSYFGPRTVINYRCTECTQVWSTNIEGYFRMEDVAPRKSNNT